MTAILAPLTQRSPEFWHRWDQLNRSSGEDHPLLQARMVQLLVEYFPAEVDTLIVEQNGHPMALVLAHRKSGGRRLSSLIGRGYLPAQSQIALVQMRPDCTCFGEYLFQGLPRARQRFDLLFVDSCHQGALASAPGAITSTRAWDMTISLSGNFSDYWQARSRNLRKNQARYHRRAAQELGGFRFEIHETAERIQDAVDRYGLLESRGWKGTEGTALHPENQQGKFYRALLGAYATTGHATVFELYHEDHLVASRLTVNNGRMLVILKTTFCEDYKRYAPGWLLLHRMVEYLFAEAAMERIELYTNATQEQLEWATHTRPVYNVSFYRHPRMGKAITALHRQIRRMREKFSQHSISSEVVR